VSGPDGVRSKRAYFVFEVEVGLSAERKSPVRTPQCLPQEIRGFLSRQESEAVHIPRVHGGDLPAACSSSNGVPSLAKCSEKMNVERISAITLRVTSMQASVRFYRDVLGMEIIYGGEDAYFSSLCTKDSKDPILNLEQGNPAVHWGRMIFYVSDVDASWAYFREKGFHPERPRDAAWGERYFHMCDPDGHELSFARPI